MLSYRSCVLRLPLELPPVEADIALGTAETKVEVVNASGSADLGSEGLVFLGRARALDGSRADDVALHAVEAQGDGAAVLFLYGLKVN